MHIYIDSNFDIASHRSDAVANECQNVTKLRCIYTLAHIHTTTTLTDLSNDAHGDTLLKCKQFESYKAIFKWQTKCIKRIWRTFNEPLI